MSRIEQRKQAHIDLCLDPSSQGQGNLFSNIALPYRALPELNFADVSTSTDLLGKRLDQPLIIASMTGGTKHAGTINKNLAIAANECGVALGVGSQRIGLKNEEAKKTFKLVRTLAPKAVIFANMGAVQLNYEATIEDYQAVVDMIKADGLYLHINPLQEAIQPEGDTNFAGLLDKIANLVKKIDVPVFAKEVGHGLDVFTAQALIDRGVKGIDCAGVGGTSYAWVEAKRAENPDFQEWFKDFGNRSDDVLRTYTKLNGDFVTILSGGVRTPIEAVKGRMTGADFYSFAQPFLQPALDSPDAVIAKINQWQKAIQIILFSCGWKDWSSAKPNL